MADKLEIFESFMNLLADKVAERLSGKFATTPGEQSDKKLLDIKAAGSYISRHPSSIRHMVASGQIPPRVVQRFGKRIFLKREELDRWLEAQQR